MATIDMLKINIIIAQKPKSGIGATGHSGNISIVLTDM